MIITDITKIPYSFLHKAMQKLSEKFALKRIYVDPRGELAISFKGKLSENDVKEILQEITPISFVQREEPLRYHQDYEQEETGLGWFTSIYSKEGIDYRNNL